jgi:TolA-binding protein
MRPHLFAVAALVLLPFAAQAQPVVQSQEGIALENQILQLQQQMQQLQSSGGNGGSALGGGAATPAPSPRAAPDGGMVASLLNQVNQLQMQVAKLRGDVDMLQNQVTTQHAQTEQEIGDLKFQMTNNTGTQSAQATTGQAAAPAAAAASQPSPAPSAAASASPRVLLHTAQHAYDTHDFAGAETASRAILAHAGSSPEAYPAQFLLAQSLAAQGRPQDAAIAYDNAYNLNRAGANAPASLLGLAKALAAIHQNQAACETLSSLTSQFPSLPGGLAPRVEALRHQARCS